ncbi:MAG: aminotransferase [Bacillota bacterium]|nr:aminotransferase [Bacillota bacterium]
MMKEESAAAAVAAVGVRRIRPGASLPWRNHPGDAGFDVTAAVDVLLTPGETVAVPTGLILDIPEGFEVQVRPRSGISLGTRLRIANSPGTVDHGYRDELCVIVHNSSCPCEVADPDAVYALSERGNRAGSYQIAAGERIAQLVVSRLTPVTMEWTSQEATGPNRGGGFGSSGTD